MNEKLKSLAKQVCEPAEEATRRLRMAKPIHQAGNDGLIREDAAGKMVFDLNAEAIAEMNVAIDLQKQFLASQNQR